MASQVINVESLCYELLGKPIKRLGKELQYRTDYTFYVNTDKGIWNSFSESRGGDMYTLVQEVKGLDFKTAKQWLVERGYATDDGYEGVSRHLKPEEREIAENYVMTYESWNRQGILEDKARASLANRSNFTGKNAVEREVKSRERIYLHYKSQIEKDNQSIGGYR